MRTWTDEQQAAIGERNKNILVAAAAGSGKTSVLVERIIRLIVEEGVDLDRMLIATFTQAAAGEMRGRISATLLREIENRPDRADYLRSQINLLNRASISTLHAFCMEVIKRYFHLLDIDPRFRVGDVTETGILKQEAMEELLEAEYALSNPDYLQLVEMFGGGKDDRPLQNLVLRCYEFIQSQPEPLVWLEAKVADFGLQADEFQHCPWVVSLTRQMQIELAGLRDIFSQALELAQRPAGPSSYQSALTRDQQTVAGLLEALQVDLSTFYEQLALVQFTRLAAAGKDVDAGLREEAKGLRDQGKKLIADIKTKIFFQSPEEFCRDLNEMHPGMKYLYLLVKDFSLSYQQKKLDKGMVDFNDLEHYALIILADIEVAEEYRRKYEYIFVDEYQDSNLVQETILNLIKRPDNLFLVGDVKQSIYRFRLADPTLFLAKYEAFAEQTGRPERRIDLSTNFRSRPEIIHGVNDIFRQIMSRDCGEIDYDETVYLHPGVICPEDNLEELALPALEIWLIDQQSGTPEAAEEGEEDEESEEPGEIEMEARVAAARINELYGQSFYDSQTGVCRPLEYRDIVVLMRATRQQADIYYETLMGAGIPVYADADRGFFQTLEVNIFLDLVRLIDNKRQDIPLLSVLRSPIGRFTVQDLITVRAASPAPTYLEALEDYLAHHEDELQARLQKFIGRLGEWKEQARFTDMDDFIWQLLLETGYYHYVGAMPGGLQRQANLRILLERANQFQATALKGLFHFLKFVDKLQAGSGDLGMAKILGENENVVRIMSIHKSKGLEFPVVILAGLGRGFNPSDTRAAVLFHKELGIGTIYVNPEMRVTRDTIARIAMKNRIKLEGLAEEMRILYVALTRPRDKLILLGSLKNLSRRAKKWSHAVSAFQSARARCPLDWIGPLVLRHPDGQKLRDLNETDLPSAASSCGAYHWRVEVIHRHGMGDNAEQLGSADWQQVALAYRLAPPATECELIRQRLDWQYPFPEAVKIPSKMSVSQIKELQSRDLDTLAVSNLTMTMAPQFLEAEQADEAAPLFSGAAKGTIMHFVMQHLDFDQVASAAEISSQLHNMVAMELLRAEEAQVVDTQRILNFFRAPLGQRVLQAPRVYREVPFNLLYKAKAIFSGLEKSDEELLLQGVIDLYFREGEELVLVDYKTDRITPYNREERIAAFQIQIQLYRTALEKIQGQRVKASILYLFDSEEEIDLS